MFTISWQLRVCSFHRTTSGNFLPHCNPAEAFWLASGNHYLLSFRAICIWLEYVDFFAGFCVILLLRYTTLQNYFYILIIGVTFQACPSGYRADIQSICQKCVSQPVFYDWMYLLFMCFISLGLHWFFIEITNRQKRYERLMGAIYWIIVIIHYNFVRIENIVTAS